MKNKVLVTNRWVLITGASRGIGEVFALRFASEGANLVLHGRDEAKLKELARKLESEHRIKTEIILVDLKEKTAPRKIADDIKKKSIEIFGLINNAAFGFTGKFVDVPREKYLAMVDVNVRSLVELTHIFLPEMVKRRSGFVINVSSTASYQPLPYSSIYSASKSFVTAFTEALWLEAKGTGVRVLNLCPGVTKTDFWIPAGLRNFHEEPFAQTPEAVVKTAMKALSGNQPTVISGLRNQVLVFLEKLFPHRLLLEIVLLFQNSRRKV